MSKIKGQASLRAESKAFVERIMNETIESQPQQDAPSMERYYREAYRRTLESEGKLLEKLEAAEAALTQAREALIHAISALMHEGYPQYGWILTEARAALAATQPKGTP